MIKCPTCGSEYMAGTMFCENCGTYLVGQSEGSDLSPNPGVSISGSNPASAPTAPPPTDTPESVPALAGGDKENPSGTLPLPASSPASSQAPSSPTRALRLRLLILNTGRLSNWLPEGEVQIGRTDRANGIFPQVDLDPEGGYEAGVSRKHALINKQDDAFYIKDLGSVNGSFLNKQRLAPETPQPLKDGDELRLGNIVMKVVLESN
jgi:pSer/pThr/pTyr-binding forkhead associated (FHA) protein